MYNNNNNNNNNNLYSHMITTAHNTNYINYINMYFQSCTRSYDIYRLDLNMIGTCTSSFASSDEIEQFDSDRRPVRSCTYLVLVSRARRDHRRRQHLRLRLLRDEDAALRLRLLSETLHEDAVEEGEELLEAGRLPTDHRTTLRKQETHIGENTTT